MPQKHTVLVAPDHVLRIHAPADHGFTQALGRVDQNEIAAAGCRVARESHAGATGVHHLADHHGALHFFVAEAHAAAIGDGLRRLKRVYAALRGLLDGFDAAHIQETAMNAGEGSSSGVFGGSAGAHGDSGLQEPQPLQTGLDLGERGPGREHAARRDAEAVTRQPRQVVALASTDRRTGPVCLRPVQESCHPGSAPARCSFPASANHCGSCPGFPCKVRCGNMSRRDSRLPVFGGTGVRSPARTGSVQTKPASGKKPNRFMSFLRRSSGCLRAWPRGVRCLVWSDSPFPAGGAKPLHRSPGAR